MTAVINNRIEGTRITVWDIYQYTIVGWSDEQILGVLPITLEQLEAAKRYIDENRDCVHEGHLRIEERNARGNSPEVVRIVDDRREKIRRRDQRAVFSDPVHGRVVAGAGIDQHRRILVRQHSAQNLR